MPCSYDIMVGKFLPAHLLEPACLLKFRKISTLLVYQSLLVYQGDKSILYSLLFSGTNDGRIFKISRWRNQDGKYESNLLDIFDATSPEPIRAMVISRELKTLFVSSDSVIKQIPIQKTCSKSYSNCVECVRDPHCGWNR